MKHNPNKRNYDLMSKNQNHWKGILYVNRQDPRMIVPKSNPLLGWTLNLGNVYTYLLFLAIILIIAASRYFI